MTIGGKITIHGRKKKRRSKKKGIGEGGNREKKRKFVGPAIRGGYFIRSEAVL